jgi:hypothetical protein
MHDVYEAIALEAAAESPIWGAALLPSAQRELRAVFSPLADARYALGLETIYEGYLCHYGRSRLFAPRDDETALLLGDYLYAHGLVRIADTGNVDAVAELAGLISLCARLRAENEEGDGEAWAATAGTLSTERTDDDAVDRALAAHRERVG